MWSRPVTYGVYGMCLGLARSMRAMENAVTISPYHELPVGATSLLVFPFANIMVDASIVEVRGVGHCAATMEDGWWGEPMISLLGCESLRQPGQRGIDELLAGVEVELRRGVSVVRDPHPAYCHHASGEGPSNRAPGWHRAKFVHHEYCRFPGADESWHPSAYAYDSHVGDAGMGVQDCTGFPVRKNLCVHPLRAGPFAVPHVGLVACSVVVLPGWDQLADHVWRGVNWVGLVLCVEDDHWEVGVSIVGGW